MVPITFLAFLAALLVLNNDFVMTDYTGFDVAGLVMVSVGVFFYNFFREKPQQACMIEDASANVK